MRKRSLSAKRRSSLGGDTGKRSPSRDTGALREKRLLVTDTEKRSRDSDTNEIARQRTWSNLEFDRPRRRLHGNPRLPYLTVPGDRRKIQSGITDQ
ncbi:unnamed protein product [Lota lota]